MKKILWIFGIGLAALIILVSMAIGLYLGPIVKIAMEQVGPKVTQVTIKVDGVDVSLVTGSAKVKGLMVGNPNGYTTPQAIKVGTIAVSMDPFSVMSNKILVRSIHVESPEITFEGGLKSNNLSKIADNVNAGSQNGGPATPQNSTQTNNKPAPKIEVDDFLITGAKVHVKLSGLGSKDITLPDIHLTDLGKDSNGLTPAELSSAILKAISRDTLIAVTSSIKDLAQGVQNLVGKGAGTTVGDSLNKITSSLGGLLGK